MAGAEGLSLTSNALLRAVGSGWTRDMTVTYSFEQAGIAVDKSGYSGGSDLTRSWSNAEKADFRAATDVFMEVSNLSLIEVSSTTSADVHLQMVDSVPGGWAGYAGTGTTFVVGSTSEKLLTHEFAHSLGLGHPFDSSLSTGVLPGVTGTNTPGDFGFNATYYSVMAYRVGSYFEYPDLDTADPTSLGVLDIAALQVMYGANDSTRVGNDTYEAGNTAQAIWDAGGIDTIDYSSLTTDAVIDLRAATLELEEGGLGRPSLTDVSTGANDVGSHIIAYGVTIENGFSGSGNDLLTGNAANNELRGGLGNDTLLGGAGDDLLLGGGSGSIPIVPLAELNSETTRDRALEVENYDGLSGSMTLDMVLRLDDSTAEFSRIFSYRPDNNTDFRFDVQYFHTEGDHYLAILYQTETGSRTAWMGIREEQILDGSLHRLTISRDASTGEFRSYLDGEFRHAEVVAAGTGFTPGGSLVIGQSQGAWTPANSSRAAMSGAVGAIAIYDSVLSDGDIAEGSLATLADPTDSRLVDYWVPDATSNSFTSVVGSSALATRNAVVVNDTNLAGDDDVITAGAGDDSVYGGAGSDTLILGVASDDVSVSAATNGVTLSSTEGVDFVANDVEFFQFTDRTVSYAEIAGTGSVTPVTGTSAGENVTGTAGGEVINAMGGGDWITPGGGSDTIDGGAGNDMVSFVDLADTPGRSNVEYRLDIDLTAGTARNHDGSEQLQISNVERISGTIFADRIKGDAGDNHLRGLGDYDWFTGTTGNDTLDGGSGQDMVSYVDWSNSAANAAHDFFSNDGAPPASGNVTGVVVDLNDTSNNTNLAAGHIYDSIERITGSGRQDVFYGDGSENDFRGLGDYDWFVGSSGGRERYFGGDGVDTVTYFLSTAGVTASLRNGALVNGEETGYGTGGDAARDLFFEIENLIGTNSNDSLTGNSGRNLLSGLDGDDFIFGYGGIDQLKGGLGDDTLNGGAASDYAIYEGNAADYTLTRTDWNTVTISGAEGTDSLIDIEYFRFADGDLQIWDLDVI